MSAFRNKHVVVAMLVAPLLALGSYFALDTLLGEKPAPAEQGQSYPLAERPNCRYNSGTCGLVNGDFELKLSTKEAGADRFTLILTSAFPLDGVMIALAETQADVRQPEAMQALGSDGREWSLDIVRPDPEHDRLQLVASANQALYFGDVATKFMADNAARTGE